MIRICTKRGVGNRIRSVREVERALESIFGAFMLVICVEILGTYGEKDGEILDKDVGIDTRDGQVVGLNE